MRFIRFFYVLAIEVISPKVAVDLFRNTDHKLEKRRTARYRGMITPVDAKYRFSYQAGQSVPAGAGGNEKPENGLYTSAIRGLQKSVKDQAVGVKGCKT
jgi:hypothetical protein